jgi:phosphoglycolate phosphatase
MPTLRFRHLIFDLDGTLANTRDDIVHAVNHTLVTLGLPRRPPEQVTGFVGHGARLLIERALGPDRTSLLPKAMDVFIAYYREHLLDRTVAYDGIPELLAAAQARGVALTVLTNKPEAPSLAILKGLGLLDFFAAVVGGDTFPTRKPDPQGVHHLARVTRIPLEDTLLVGDSQVDCETGRAAGIRVCGVTWGFVPDSLKAVPPDFTVASAAELNNHALT